jgi:hypothetical protein
MDASAEDKSYSKDSMQAFHAILTQFFGKDAADHFLKYDITDLVHVKVSVNEVYDQTPGPGAGKQIYPN